MAVRKILRIGHPQLRLAAKAVERVGGETLSALVNDMLDTMQAFDGAGLAAPQIGVPLRVVIFGIDKNPRYPDAPPIPLTILLNPEFSPVDEAMDSAWEGCLSVPGMRGLVLRYTRIRYRGLGADGRELEREVEGFHARVVQHECDHLDGTLYPDRLEDRRMFGFIEELQVAHLLRSDVRRESESTSA